MHVDLSCKKRGAAKRMDISLPQSTLDEHPHFIQERLSHRPGFQCFGGHFELAPALPDFWVVHWGTVGESPAA